MNQCTYASSPAPTASRTSKTCPCRSSRRTAAADAAAGLRTALFFNRSPAGQDSGWHTAPRRQYVIGIAGVTELTLRDGTSKRFGPGDVLLAEDVTGSGHHTKVVGDEDRVSLMIPLCE